MCAQILIGAKRIANWYGDEVTERQVFYWHETGAVPIFKIGTHLAARPATLEKHMAEQERAALKGESTA